ncbi:hypothetical protein BH09BAC5_BH09BAC5_11050 [soil metagenome]
MKKILILFSVFLSANYLFAQNTWLQKANFSGGVRYGTVSFSVGSLGYIGLGWNGSSYANDFWSYDPTTNTWTQVANFLGPARISACSFVIGAKAYVGTGLNYAVRYNDFYEYNPATNTWTLRANYPGSVRYPSTGRSVGNHGSIGLGTYSHPGHFYSDFYEYDPVLDSWNIRAAFPGAIRCGSAGFCVGSKGYLGLGSNYAISMTYSDFYEFNPSTNSWLQKNNFPGPARSNSASFSIGSRGFIGTGITYPSGIFYNDFWEYNPTNDSWIQRANFPGVARTSTGFSIGNNGYIGTGSNGSYQTDFYEYTPVQTLTATASSTGNNCFGDNNGTASVTATGGTAPYTYSWSPSGGTNSTASGLSAGTYTCLITDALNTTYSQTVTVTQPSQISPGLTIIGASCNGTGSANSNPTGGTGPYTFNWSTGGTASTESNLSLGNYAVSITDANGCIITQTFAITNAPPPQTVVTALNVSCFGGSNGSAIISVTGGAPPFTYAWSPSGGNAASANGLTAGTYTCTVTDANGCNYFQTTTISQPTALISSSVAGTIMCHGGNTSATVVVSGGTPSYNYSWAPTGGNGQTATGMTAGSYSCTISDTYGCSIQETFTITEPSVLSPSAISTNLQCYGDQNGTASAIVIGGTPGYTYNWLPAGGTAQTASGLSAGTYTISVTDANGCIANNTVAVTSPPQIVSTIVQSNSPTCNGDCNGAATLTTTGGSGNYTYNWTQTGCTTPSCTGLCAGSYSVIVTDSTGCSSTAIVPVTQPDLIVATETHTDETFAAMNDGTATAIVNGGTAPYTYAWAPSGGTGATATGLGAGTYTCTITDVNGCTGSVVVTIVTADGVGINNPETGNLLVNVFPNPVHDFVQIQINLQQSDEITLEVFDIIGNKLDEIDFGKSDKISYSYNVSHYANGIYLFKVTEGNSNSSTRITVAK